MMNVRPGRRGWRWLAGLVAATVLVGCGGGNNDDDGNADELVRLGTERLNAALTARTFPSAQELGGISATFDQAYNQDNSNRHAAFGSAIAGVALAAQHLVETLEAGRGGRGPSDDALTQAARSVLPWQMSAPTPSGAVKTIGLAVAAPYALNRVSRAVDPNLLRNRIGALESAITRGVGRLTPLASDAQFSYVIANFRSGAPAGSTITVDRGDVQTILAGMYAARGVVRMTLVWDFDWSGFDFGQPISQRFPGLIAGAEVRPDDYLPPAPFGAVAAGGGALMAGAKSDFVASADTVAAAVNTLRTRTDGAENLIEPGAGTDYDAILAGAGQFRNALDNPFTTSTEPGLTINLNAWFTNPPSLRALMPTYVFTGGPLVASFSTYPDRTLGGLLVDPPAELDFQAVVYPDERVGALAERAFIPAL